MRVPVRVSFYACHKCRPSQQCRRSNWCVGLYIHGIIYAVWCARALVVGALALYMLCVFKHEITCENGMLNVCSIMNESNSFRQKKGKKSALNFHGILHTDIPKFLK